MNRRNIVRLVFLFVVATAIALALFYGEYFSLARLKASRDALAAWAEARPLLALGGFFLVTLAATACCFPAAPIIGLSAGALFGFWTGFPLVLTASACGSTIAFLAARTALRDWVEARFGARMAPIDRGFERHGAFYLLALRFNPLIPYWLVNLAMGITRMRLGAYVPLTLIGLSPATFIYVDAGTRLATLTGISDILSPGLIAALILLSLFPLIADRAGSALRARTGGES
ncbi:MAG: hypothetical protein QOI38_1476 [Sphingomonadales bacterium]|jgi:uncharacterized membrane protein YdjX (TVP38/TMEM64 family)|nr:hypothetical protein [Sphingomonadales bacterium]